jgi:hypothetical protein
MLAQLLEELNIPAITLPPGAAPEDALNEISTEPNDVVCISAVPPFALLNARSLSKKLSVRFPHLRILVGLWNSVQDAAAEQRIEKAVPGEVVRTLAQAVERIRSLVADEVPSETPQPIGRA